MPSSYVNLALQFSTQNFNGDAANGLLPSVSSVNGFGSFVDNPATIALIEENSFNFGLYNSQVEMENSYLDNTEMSEDNNFGFGNIGVVYKIPTSQGSFVLGAGYNQLSDMQDVTRIEGRNTESTITDGFRETDSDYYDIAFDAYATDWGDVDSTYKESIFRIGFTSFPGINQEAEIIQSTNIGEYSFFFGTEFQENLYVGISAGITSGNYKYRRNFLEIDKFDFYNAAFIPSDTEGEFTDVDNILTYDEIDADIVGYAIRGGLLYEFSNKFKIGLSYLIPSTTVIQEQYYSSITTELDDGSTPFQSDFASDGVYEYRIKKPAEFKAGITLSKIWRFDFSASAEYVNYSNLRLDFITGNDLSFNTKVALRDQQDEIENFISSTYKPTTNLKAGIGFAVNKDSKIKAGYAYLPGRSSAFEATKNVVSAGFTTSISNNVVLDLMGQYSFWNDRSIAYSYFDYEDGGAARSERIDHDIQTIKILAGIRFLF
ncbi:MAG: outer membrane protein transport protein [Gracilimonas sp.]|nr:outer membrane protein transport protein [Gracilimonas sp.]